MLLNKLKHETVSKNAPDSGAEVLQIVKMIFQWLSFLFIRDKPKKEVPTFESIFQSPFKNFRPIFAPVTDPPVTEPTSPVVENDSPASIPIEAKTPFFDDPQFYRGSQEAFPYFAGCKKSCYGVGECAPEICDGYCCKPTTQACPEAARKLVEGTTFECISWFGELKSKKMAPLRGKYSGNCH